MQFVQGGELKESASRQQTLNKIISLTRGAIVAIIKLLILDYIKLKEENKV